jgi:hypothetical protein
MNEDIKIIDNLLPERYTEELEKLITGTLFEWFYAKDIAYEKHDELKQVNDGFSHIFHLPSYNSKHYDFVKPMLYHIEEKLGIKMHTIIRVRANLLQKAHPGDMTWNNEHIDYGGPHWVGIYYLNDTDGPTYVFDQRLSQIPAKNKTDKVINDFVRDTEFTVAQAIEPKRGRLAVFDGDRFHASSKPRDHNARFVIAINWKQYG